MRELRMEPVLRQQKRAGGDAQPLIEIDRAITDLRRGGVVVLRTPDTAILVAAAESVTDEALERVTALASLPLALAITRRRAAVLGLAEQPSGPGGSVLLVVPQSTPAALLSDLADPAA